MRIAVMALRNAADVRINTSSTMRPSHSSLSRSVIDEVVDGQQSTVYRQQEDGSGTEPIFAHPNRQSPAPGFLAASHRSPVTSSAVVADNPAACPCSCPRASLRAHQKAATG